MISFIIPAYNEEALVGHCVSAIRGAMESVGEAYEMIVVDDSSTDTTSMEAAQQGARVIHVANRKISAARNAGAREARGEVLFFVDADTLVSAEVFRSALQAIGEGAMGGGCLPRFEGRLPLWFRVAYPFMVAAMRWPLRQTGGACVFCTRAGFEATGGFSESHYAAEEDVWVKALKRHGRFVVLAEPVITSGRSLRTQSFWTIARMFARLALRGADGFCDRRELDIWYRPSREKTRRS